MRGMSLIPSESASFPDLVGHEHGFRHPKARRASLRRKQRKVVPPKAQAQANRAEQSPIEGADELQPLSSNESEEQISPSEVSPDLDVQTAEDDLQPLSLEETEEQLSASNLSPAPPTQDVAHELLLPLSFNQPAEEGGGLESL